MLMLVDIIYANGENKDGKTEKIENSRIPTTKSKSVTNTFIEIDNTNNYKKDRSTSHTISSWAKVTDVAKLKKLLRDQRENYVNKIQTVEQKLAELEKETQSLKKELETFKTANKFELAGYEMFENRVLYLDIGALFIGVDNYYYSIKELTPEMVDYKTINTYITNSSYATDKNCKYDVDVVKIFVLQYKKDGNVNIPDNKTRDPNRRLLFHGTSVQNAKIILENIEENHSGYEIKESKGWLKFGKGIYFTDRMCFAAEYAYGLPNPNDTAKGIIFLNEVALGKQYVHNRHLANYYATTYDNIPENADSIFAQGTKIPEPGVEGVLDDGTAVPYGRTKVAGFKAGRRLLDDYNEYIVYRESQAKVRYFIYAKIKPAEA